MSQETFQIICNMDIKNVETQVVLQCAPVLMNVKISNLLMLPSVWKNEIKSLFEELPLELVELYEHNGKTAFLVYRPLELSKYLNEQDTACAMQKFGYEKMELGEIVERFSIRYGEYHSGEGEYPHEIGLILGYPTEDVLGFIEHGGKDYAYSGYWKVYGNVAVAVMRFKMFDYAKESGIQMLNRGHNIKSIVR